MHMISRPAQLSVYRYPEMLKCFSLSWFNIGIKAEAIANGKKPRKMKPFNQAMVTEGFESNPDLECFIRVLIECFQLFSSIEGLKLIQRKICVLMMSDNFDLKQGKICLERGSGLFTGFLRDLEKERLIQAVSIIERPLWRRMIDADLASLKTPFAYSSKPKTISLTVQTGGSKKQSISEIWNFHHLSREVVEEDTLMDQSIIQSVKRFTQYCLLTLTSAEDETDKKQSPVSSVSTAQDWTVKKQSLVSSVISAQEGIVENQSFTEYSNYVLEETLYHSQQERNLQFGMLESEESWKLGPFVPIACTDPSQSGLSKEEFKPTDGLKRGLFTRKEDHNLEFEDLPADIEMLDPEKEKCTSPGPPLGDMDLSPPRHASKESCGVCYTKIGKSQFFAQRRYGLLSNCKHVFCYPCIYKQSKPTSITCIRSAVCPICLKKSAAIAASPVWMEGAEKYNFFKKFAEEIIPGSRSSNTCSTATLFSRKRLEKNILLERSFSPCVISV